MIVPRITQKLTIAINPKPKKISPGASIISGLTSSMLDDQVINFYSL